MLVRLPSPFLGPSTPAPARGTQRTEESKPGPSTPSILCHPPISRWGTGVVTGVAGGVTVEQKGPGTQRVRGPPLCGPALHKAHSHAGWGTELGKVAGSGHMA